MSYKLQSSILRKVAMALSGLFLIIFLTQHFIINITSVFSPNIFNMFSHFMGNNFIVQFIAQPILIIGVLFHFIMGFILEYQNRSARTVKYIVFKGNKNSSWISRNMLLSGAVILSFLFLHFYDFWIPEMKYKYVDFSPLDPERYYPELVHKFNDPIKVIIYCVSFLFLAMHLSHGFASSFKSLGTDSKFNRSIKLFTKSYAILIPAGFCFIAIFHLLVSNVIH
ncbi:MAG: succinate dehydrogenase [Flavobacteriaceae bacterium]|nr:succinate dehydrogenase [Flavobacteriaceae bacterium]